MTKKKTMTKTNTKTKTMTKKMHLGSTFKERSQGLVTFGTLEEETGPDQKLTMTKTNTKTKTMRNTFREQVQRQR